MWRMSSESSSLRSGSPSRASLSSLAGERGRAEGETMGDGDRTHFSKKVGTLWRLLASAVRVF
jgi:hypothetical protein